METSKTFGDTKEFAIIYQACSKSYNYTSDMKMAICHLVISNNIIGRPSEECFLPTWLYNLTDRRNRIADTKQILFPKQFIGFSDREIFESILKANQLPEEFHPDFLYLPQLENVIWDNHRFTIDETTDGCLLYFYIKEDKITFLVEKEAEDIENDQRSDVFIFHTVNLYSFLQIIDNTVSFLVKEYPFLKNHISTRTLNAS